ncbi:MAG: class I SAM-dependent methyltransferase [Candidatus Sumerlaeia bacterium]|nr:class I SAM-dependent methyltransferase [Candidatus Sumerlaeia bacterium]
MADLPFDSRVRYLGVLAALDCAGLSSGRVLDVGGFPGAFARFCAANGAPFTVHTADTAQGDLENYTRLAPGAPLPFPDRAFDAVVSVDTLEHVPTPARHGFLAELCRAADRAVVVAAPFHHDATAAAEQALDALHRQVRGAPHPWLSEHREHGLPRVAPFLAAIPPEFRLEAARPNAPLLPWTLWQAFELARQFRDAFEEPARHWDSACNSSIADGSFPAGALPYRVVWTLRRGGVEQPLPAFLAEFESHGGADAALAPALAGMLGALVAAAAVPAGADVLRHAIDERLAAAMRLLEQQAGRRGPAADGPRRWSWFRREPD